MAIPIRSLIVPNAYSVFTLPLQTIAIDAKLTKAICLSYFHYSIS